MPELHVLKVFRRACLSPIGKTIKNVRFFSTIPKMSEKSKNENVKFDNNYIFNSYKLKDLNFLNFRIITNYDEYFKTIIENEYFKDYGDMSEEESSMAAAKRKIENSKIEKGLSEDLKKRNDAIATELEYVELNKGEMDTNKNIIVSNDLQVLFFGSYENNISLVLFEKFKDIIEKNKKLQFFFIDINTCPQCAYNCQINFVPSIVLIYKNHLYRKKLEFDYENPANESYLNEFLGKVQQSIDHFHSFNNKFVYSLKKQSNYLNTKYIDIDNQNIHKQNWNTF